VVAKIHSKKQSKSSKTKDPILIEKKKIAKEFFNGCCYICRKNYGKYFAFHHQEYYEDDLTSEDFNNTIWYHTYLLPLVLEEPERFWLLCRKCHFHQWLADIPSDQLGRLFEVVCATKPRKHVKRINKLTNVK